MSRAWNFESEQLVFHLLKDVKQTQRSCYAQKEITQVVNIFQENVTDIDCENDFSEQACMSKQFNEIDQKTITDFNRLMDLL